MGNGSWSPGPTWSSWRVDVAPARRGTFTVHGSQFTVKTDSVCEPSTVNRQRLSKKTFTVHGSRLTVLFLLAFILYPLPSTLAFPRSPPEQFEAFDMLGDGGGSVGLSWRSAPYDAPMLRYRINIADQEGGPFAQLAEFSANTHYKSDVDRPWWSWDRTKDFHFYQVKSTRDLRLVNGRPYFFKVAVTDGTETLEGPIRSAVPEPNLFNWAKANNFLLMVLFSALVLVAIAQAKRRPNIFLRRIPGLDAVEEAIGRATEMGRPILYLTGSDDMSSLSICFRYLAGALGISFIPIKSLLASEVLERLERGPAAADLRRMTCPFTGEEYVVMKALTPDVSVVHVQVADREGNCQIEGPRWENEEQAKAARRIIVVTEELVSTEYLRRNPERTVIPAHRVEAVIHQPFGAHPTSVFRCYDYDAEHLRLYVDHVRRVARVNEYLETYILGTKDHWDYLEKVGGMRRLDELRADRILGY